MMAADAIYYPGTPPDRMLPDIHDDDDHGGAEAFRASNRWTTTATNGSGLQQGDSTTITWSIVPDGGQSNLIARLDAIYGGGSGPLSARPWFPLISSAFNSWTLQSGLKFVYEANDDNATMSSGNVGVLGVRGDMRINGTNIDGNFNVLGFAFLPNYGEITLDTNDVFYADTSSNSIGLRNVLTHEIGHALGLLHTCPIDQSKLMEPFYSPAFDGPQIDDILAVNRLYGDRLEPNDTRPLATNLGTLNSGTVTTSSVSVDGTSDTDLYSFTVTGTTGKRLSATLRPEGASYLEGPQNSDGSCSAGTIFNSRVENNLSIEILDTDGTTVLAAATSAPAGVNETLSGLVLPVAGTYFVRIKGATDRAQMYSLDLTVTQGSVTGPTLIGIQPNAVGLFDVDNPFDFKVPTNNQLTVAPQQLTFRFDASSGLDPATLSGIELYRTGSDGRFDVAYGATDLGTVGTLSPAILDFSAVKLGQSENSIQLNFTAADLGANVTPRVTVTGQTIDVVLNTHAGIGSRSTAQMVVDALNQNANARVLVKTQLRGGLNGSADVAGITGPVSVQLAGADVPKASSSFGAPAPLEVRLTAVNATAGNPVAIGVYKAALGTAGVPQITVDSVRNRIYITLDTTGGTTAQQLVTAINGNAQAAGLVRASIPFGAGTTNVASTAPTQTVLMLGRDERIVPGFLGLGTTNREVIARFASTLVNDLYRVEIQSQDNPAINRVALRNIVGQRFEPTFPGLDRDINEFTLELGPQVVAVVPQPVTRMNGPGGAFAGMTQARDTIEVYFNEDDLRDDATSAENVNFYQLVVTNDTVRNTDDVVFKPTTVSYDPVANKATLKFADDLTTLAGGAATFRLRVGTDETPLPAAPTSVNVTTDAADSFGAANASALGTLSASNTTSVIINSTISNGDAGLSLPLDFMGGVDDPGHRDIPVEVHSDGPDASDAIRIQAYNFQDVYGQDPFGVDLHNQITEEQKQRAREIFDLYSRYSGIRFVETPASGYTIVTGDLRALDPTIPTGAGGVAGLAGGSLAIMDAAESWTNQYGGSWMSVALHEIGHLLGQGHTYDLPYTDQGPLASLPAYPANPEAIFPSDADLMHMQYMYRPDGMDVDMYRFDVPVGTSGDLSVEVFAERMADSSQLDATLRLYRETSPGVRELVTQNDDYYSQDSLLKVGKLPAGTYFIAVAAKGTEYDPSVAQSSLGGKSQGDYQLRVDFRPAATNSIVDNAGTALDGDGDGTPGGVYNFWFRSQTVNSTPAANNTLFVDKSAPSGGNGTMTTPFNNLSTALAAATAGQIVRVIANPGTDNDLDTTSDNQAYELGRGGPLNTPLSDGATMVVPKGVTVMIDNGAIIKVRGTRIGVGSTTTAVDVSGGALQVLGTPDRSVFFTSYNDKALGTSTNDLPTTPAAGDWGGLDFRENIDRAQGRFTYDRQGIFLNYVNNADMRFGGGRVQVDSLTQTVRPIDAYDVRLTATYNKISNSADAPIGATPDSFEETNFEALRYQAAGAFTPDYSRVGLEVHHNRLVNNSANGLFVRINTPAGSSLIPLTVTARLDDTDIPHIVGDNLLIAGTPGGPVRDVTAPPVNLITLTAQNNVGGTLAAGTYNYRVVYVDAVGNEGVTSAATANVTVSGANNSVRLANLPPATGDYNARRVYRSAAGGAGPYSLIGELDRSATSFTDLGRTSSGTLTIRTTVDRPRTDAGLVIDAGTIVKFDGGRIEAVDGGNFIAEGDEGHVIVFTSKADDRYGGSGTFDTNNDDNRGTSEASPVAGDWGGLFVGPLSQASIDNALITFGGGINRVEGEFAGFNPVSVSQGDLRLTNSIIESNADGTGGTAPSDRYGRGANVSAAIYISGSQPTIVGNIIRDNAGSALTINANALTADLLNDLGRQRNPVNQVIDYPSNQGPLVRANKLSGNGTNGLDVRGATLTTQSVWDDTDIVHVLRSEIVVPDLHLFGGLTLNSSPNESLVVKLQGANAGFTASGRPLDIADRIGGTVQIVGQPGFPVILTSLRDDTVGAGFQADGAASYDTNGGAGVAAAADWRSIKLDSFSNDRNVDIAYERESTNTSAPGINATPATAQYLGLLAAAAKSSDENLRLGFTLQGTLSQRNDIDIYSFEGSAGTQIWIDIDRTSTSLDSIVELIDTSGNVLARSDNSLAEQITGVINFVSDPETVKANPLSSQAVGYANSNSWDGLAKDTYSTNVRDAGFRVVLPGTVGERSLYHVRVRSHSATLNDINAGQSLGSYQLQIRLRETDELAGSTVRYADIRYATNGLELIGVPYHSPLLGEAAEQVGDNSTAPASQNLGNLMNSDRAALSVAGQVTSEADVDFYRFKTFYDSIQGTQEGPNGTTYISTTIDLDYSDGLARGNLSMWLFDAAGRLVAIGKDSNVAEDRPAPLSGNNLNDLDRGSVGKLDPFIGPINLPSTTAADEFYKVAVTSNALIPRQMDQFLVANAANPLLRLEPVNSVDRIVEEHFDLIPAGTEPATANQPKVPTLLNYDLAVDTSPVNYHLGDVVLFVNSSSGTSSSVITIDPFTGAVESTLGGYAPNTGDLALRPDGNLFTFSHGTTDAAAGNLLRIDPGTAAATSVGDDGILTFEETTCDTSFTETQQNVGVNFNAMLFTGSSGTALFAVGTRPPFDATECGPLIGYPNVLYQFNAANGAAQNRTNFPTRTGTGRLAGAGTDIVEVGIVTGVNPGELITGMTQIAGVTFIVTSQGRLGTLNLNTAAATIFSTIAGAPQFAGVTAGPATTENGAYATTLFAITTGGRLYAFDPLGQPQRVFYDNQSNIPTGATNVNGLAFSNLTENLWQWQNNRADDPGHGIVNPLDDTRAPSGNGAGSYYFGPLNSPGGAHGSLITNPFSLKGYDASDKPMLYFSYFLQSEPDDQDYAPGTREQPDAFRVFVAGDDGNWSLLGTNNSFQSAAQADERDYGKGDGACAYPTGSSTPCVQELFQNTNSWRQARIPLDLFAGEENLRLRFDFSTAGSMSVGNISTTGEELRALAGSKLRDGQTLTVSGTTPASATFEVDMGPTLIIPAGGNINNTTGAFTVTGSTGSATFTFTTAATGGNNIQVDGTRSAKDIATDVAAAITSANLGLTVILTDDYRINLYSGTFNVTVTGVTGLPTNFVEGAAGVAPANVRLRISAAMTNTQVATVFQTAMANTFAAGNLLSIKRDDDLVRMIRHSVTAQSAGPNNGPRWGFEDSLPGDVFGENDEAIPSVSANLFLGAGPSRRGVSNAFEGVYLDDIIIGFAERGEMVTNATNDMTFRDNTELLNSDLPDQSPEILTGPYQIEMRRSAEFWEDNQFTPPARLVTDGIDTNGRVAQQITLVAPMGAAIADGDQFVISDGVNTLTFEYEDLNLAAGSPLKGVTAGNVLVGFRPTFKDHEVAARMRDAINSSAVQGVLDIKATLSDGTVSGTLSTDNRVNLIGNAQSNVNGATDFGLPSDFVLYLNRTSGGGSQVLAIDPFTASVANAIGTYDDVAGDLAARPDGSLFTFTNGTTDATAGNFLRISPINGDSTNLGDDNIQTFEEATCDGNLAEGPQDVGINFNAMMFTGSTGNSLYAIGDRPAFDATDCGPLTRYRNVLYVFNAANGSAQNSGGVPSRTGTNRLSGAGTDIVEVARLTLPPGGTSSETITGMTRLGTVDYVVTNQGRLMSINLTTGALTLIATVNPPNAPVFAGLTTRPAGSGSGVYGDMLFGVTSGGRIYAFDITGALQPVFYGGRNNIRTGLTGVNGLTYSRLDQSQKQFVQYNFFGDENRERDQGQVVINSNIIRDASQWGILVDNGPRSRPDLMDQPGGIGVLPHPGFPKTADALNTDRLTPGAVLLNNVLVGGGNGGIRISGDNTNNGVDSAVSFVRVFNNTIYGRRSGDTGIQIDQFVSPTLLNNIVANLNTGINITADAATSTTVIGGTLYQNNNTNASTGGIGLGSFPITLATADPLFVSTARRNFYLQSLSKAIDSSLGSLQDRNDFLTRIKQPLGIAASPIIAPELDVTGQLRYDDPTVATPSGQGSNVYIDRGAFDRNDFNGPFAELVVPQDNDSEGRDVDQTLTVVKLNEGVYSSFDIVLKDGLGSALPVEGTGIDQTTVNTSNVLVFRDGVQLQPSVDYVIGFQAGSNLLRITPLSGVWRNSAAYVITLSGIKDLAGNLLQPNQADGSTRFTILMPGVVLDYGDAFDNQPTQRFATFFVNNGARHVVYDNATTIYLGRFVDAEVDANPTLPATSDDTTLGTTIDSLITATALSVDTTLSSGSLTYSSVTGRLTIGAVSDGDAFEITNRGTTVKFVFDSDGREPVAPTIVIPFNTTDTTDMIADKVVLAIGRSHIADVVTGAGLSISAVKVSSTDVELRADNDEDGLRLGGDLRIPLNPNTTVTPLDIVASGVGYLDAWFDWNADGDWADPNEHYFINSLLATGVNRLNIFTPISAATNVNIATRFRFSLAGGLTSDNVSVGGEVEDYSLRIFAGNPPVPTTDTYVVREDDTLTVNDTTGTVGTANDNSVLLNDTDANGDSFRAFLVTPPTHAASFVLNPDGTFVYKPLTNYNGPDSFTYRLRDLSSGMLVSNTLGTVNITVQEVNEAPIAYDDLPSGTTLTTLEDPASPNFYTFNSNDLVLNDKTPFGDPSYTVPTGTVDDESAQTLQVSSLWDGTNKVLTVTTTKGGTVTLNSVGGTLTYTPPADFNFQWNPGGDNDSFQYYVRDNGTTAGVADPLDSLLPATAFIKVLPVNDAPFALFNGGQTFPTTAAFTVNEDDPAGVSLGSALSASDPDLGRGEPTDAIQVTLEATNGTISVVNTGTGATITGASTTTVIFTGTRAQVNGALVGIVFLPDLNYNSFIPGGTPATIKMTVNDLGNNDDPTSGLGALTDTETVIITVNAVNDAPVNVFPATPPNLITYEDITTFAFTGANKIQVTDVDVRETAADPSVIVFVSAVSGNLTIGTTPTGVTVTNNTSHAVTITGDIDLVNSALLTLSYQSDLNFNGVETITILTDDLGHTGSGGALTDTDTVLLTVLPTNDAPINLFGGTTFTTTPTLNVDEDTNLVFTGATRLTTSDVDVNEGTGIVQVTLTATNGILTVVGSITGTTITNNDTSVVTVQGPIADVNSVLDGLIFRNSPTNFNNTNAIASVVIKTDDLGNTGYVTIDGPLNEALTDTDTVLINVVPINDAPVNQYGGSPLTGTPSRSVNEDEPLVFTGTTRITVADADYANNEGNGDVKVTLSVTSGTLTIVNVVSGVTVTDNGTKTVVLTGPLNNVNAALDQLTYQGNLHFNGSDAVVVTSDDLGNSGSVGGMTGVALTDTDTISLTVNPMNDGPLSVIPPTQFVDEDTLLTFSAANGNAITVSDVDVLETAYNPAANAGVLRVVISESVGAARFDVVNGTGAIITNDNTSSVTIVGTPAQINAALDGMTFLGNLNFSGAALVNVFVDDLGNSGNSNTTQNPGYINPISSTITVNVTAVNDAPINQWNGSTTFPAIGAITMAEDAGTLTFSNTTSRRITVSDLEAGSAGTVQVRIVVNNGTITLPSTTGLVFSEGDGTADPVMQFTGSVSNINNRLNGFTFRPTANFDGLASIVITTNDRGLTGKGGPLEDTDTVPIVVTPVNDSPSNLVPVAQSVDEDTDLVFSNANGNPIIVTDDAGAQPVEVTLSAANGVLTLSRTTGLDFSFSGGLGDGTADTLMKFRGTLADINAALDGLIFRGNQDFNGSASVTITLNDLGNTGGVTPQSDTDTIAITVRAVNDAPVNLFNGLTTPFTATTNDEEPITFSSTSSPARVISITDVDAGAAGIVRVSLTAGNGFVTLSGRAGLTFTVGDGTDDATMSFTGTMSNINTALNGIIFRPADFFNGTATLAITTNDNGNTGSGGIQTDTDVVNITVVSVNDPPVNNVPATQNVAEDVPLVLSAANANALTISDDATTTSSPVRVTVTTTVGTLTLSGLTGLTLISGDNGTSTFTYEGQVGNINTALNGLTLATPTDFNGAVTVSITTNDLGNSPSSAPFIVTNSFTVNVIPQNDAPVNLLAGTPITTPVTLTVAEDTDLTLTGANRLGVSDVDVNEGDGRVSVNLAAANGLITVVNSLASVTVTNNGTGSVTVVGPITDVNSVINGVTYRGAANFNGTDSLVITTSDLGNRGFVGGVNNQAQIDTDSITITVSAVNDAPVVNAPTQTQSTLEDTALVFSVANGNVITIMDDSGSNAIQVTISSLNGLLTLSQVTGLDFSFTGAQGDGTADATMTFRGTTSAINGALNGLAFTPASNFSGSTSISFQVDDLGNTGTGGALTGSGSVTVDVLARNDAPVNNLPAAQFSPEDIPLIFLSENGNWLTVSDVDAGSGTIKVTLTATNGLLTLGDTLAVSFSGGAGDGVSDATMTFFGTVSGVNQALSGLRFVPTADYFGSATLTIRTDDQGNTGAGGALVDTDVLSITVTAVNDPPIPAPVGRTTAEDTALTVSIATLIANDVPGPSNEASQVLTFGGVIATSAQGGTVAVVGNNVVYTPAANFFGTDTFQYRITDNGQTNGIADPKTSLGTVTVVVTAVNDAPIAVNDSYTMDKNTTLVRSALQGVLVNDSDVEGSPLTATRVSGPTVSGSANPGTLTLGADGSFTYRPAANYVGPVTFTYRANDGQLNSNIATVTITVNNTNNPPVAVNDAATTTVGGSVLVTVLANDSDSDGSIDPASVSIAANPTRGSVVVNANGTVLYTPTGTTTGSDTFQYTVRDDAGAISNSATVTITINPAPPLWQNPPRVMDVNNDTFTTPIDALLIINELNVNTLNLGPDRRLPTNGAAPPPFYDVNGDGFLTPNDSLIVINFLNSGVTGEGAGEGEGGSTSSLAAMDEVLVSVSNSTIQLLSLPSGSSTSSLNLGGDLGTGLFGSSSGRARRVLEIPVMMPLSTPVSSNAGTRSAGNAWDPMEEVLDSLVSASDFAHGAALDAALDDILGG